VLKDVIFSNISIQDDGKVGFSVSATLDPSFILYSNNQTNQLVPATPPPQPYHHTITMRQFLIPIILVAAAIGLFVLYTNPTYQRAKNQAQVATYNDALDKSQELRQIETKKLLHLIPFLRRTKTACCAFSRQCRQHSSYYRHQQYCCPTRSYA
jgi:hypothetical protein